MYRIPKSFEAPSPDSVLERLIATSSGKTKTIPLGPEVTIPVKARTNRSRPVSTSNSWSKSLLLVPLEKAKKKRRAVSELPDNENKKCTHCQTTKTPQWREGPMGPKTLCNACGVRYRSGRLFPEYRPAASPTFIPSLHSNSHKKVIEMRQKGVGVDGSSFVTKPRTAISYPVGAGDGVFVKKPTATTIPYPVGAGAGVFVKKPTTTIPYPVGAGDGVFVKKPTAAATTMPYPVGAGDEVFVKKPTATTMSYPVGAGDGVFAKKPPYPVGAGDGVFVKKPTTATIPFPAGAGYGVFVNKPMGSIPTLARLGSD
ncbi:GATA transcription factor 11-like protein [Tanacetum coccineum]